MPTPRLPAETIDRVRRLLEAGKSRRQAARAAGVSLGSVTNIAAGLTEPAEDPVGRERRRAEEDARRREHVSAVKELAFRDFLSKLVEENARPVPAVPAPRPVRPGKARDRYPHLLLTDWHFEEVVRAEGVLGLNSYDIPTACRRAYRVAQATRAWKRDLEAAGRFRVPELTVALNGDFLTGTLHGLERHIDAPNVVRAALACGDLIALALADLARDFPKVRVVGTVGNHGRLPDDKKVPTKDPTRSWDYLAYGIARRRLAATPHVEFVLPEAYGVLYEMAGHQCYQAHGNFIPQSLGIIGYGIRRFAASLSANLSSAGKPLKYAFFGHWHSQNAAEFAGITAFVGPSLIGTQEYGFLGSGAVTRAAQQLTVFDRELGHTGTEVIYADGSGYEGTYEVTV